MQHICPFQLDLDQFFPGRSLKFWLKCIKNLLSNRGTPNTPILAQNSLLKTLQKMWQMRDTKSAGKCEQMCFMKLRIQTGNQIRGLLAEFGGVRPARMTWLPSPPMMKDSSYDAGYNNLRQAAPGWLAAESSPGVLSGLAEALYSRMLKLREDISDIEKKSGFYTISAKLQSFLRLFQGGLLTATATAAGIADRSQFSAGRKFSCATGLTLREGSRGGKRSQTGITRRGTPYTRSTD